MTPSAAGIDALIRTLEGVRADMLQLVEDSADLLASVHPTHRASARNLLHYVALRSRDLRPLQASLATLGLSSLGRAESHALSAVDAVLFALRRMRGDEAPMPARSAASVDMDDGQRLLDANTVAVLGPRPTGRGVAIMVTMPGEAADDYTLIADLLGQGMDCMRINCAHDDPEAWVRMVGHLQRARVEHQRPCRILMDLAGPKLRTGPLEPGPSVTKIRPTRDVYGRVTDAAHVWLFDASAPTRAPRPAAAALPLPGSWLAHLAPDDRIQFTDARGASRRLRVLSTGPDGCWADARRTCYVQSGTEFSVSRTGRGTETTPPRTARVGELPSREQPLRLAEGDELILGGPSTVGRAAVRGANGEVLRPATIGCSAEEVLVQARPGDRVWFDDGRIGGVIERCEPGSLVVRIVRTRSGGAKLRAEKGINLPDTALDLPAITPRDRDDLRFVVQHADMVALSFANTAADVRALGTLLAPLGDQRPAVVLKIETKQGFDHLPAMLLEAMTSPRCAVMIARGDLAVECGFERLAEVQEEILWLCEAAHVPVIWATQVLESLAREGVPSRAEVTDAAMAHRAECVMLNKGPYILRAVQVLDDILRRMHGHQSKKRAMLRELHLVQAFRRTRP